MLGADEVDADILGRRVAASLGSAGLERAADNALNEILPVLPQEFEGAGLFLANDMPHFVTGSGLWGRGG